MCVVIAQDALSKCFAKCFIEPKSHKNVFLSHYFQTAEEIEKLTVDEDLNDIERAVFLLR